MEKIKMNYKKNIFLVLIMSVQMAICSGSIMMLNSADDFNTFIDKNDTLSVVKFYATWCEFSQKNEPLYQDFAKLYEKNNGVQFGEVDVDNLVDIRKSYGIDRTPYFLIFKSGVMIDKTTSFNGLKNRVSALTKQKVASLKKNNIFSNITNALMKPIRVCKSFFM